MTVHLFSRKHHLPRAEKLARHDNPRAREVGEALLAAFAAHPGDYPEFAISAEHEAWLLGCI